MFSRKKGKLVPVTVLAPKKVETLAPEHFAAIEDILPVNSAEQAVFDNKLNFVGHSFCEDKARQIATIARPILESLLDTADLDPRFRKVSYIVFKAQRTITPPNTRRMLKSDKVLTWHRDGLSLLASNRLVTEYVVGSTTVDEKLLSAAGIAEHVMRYEWMHEKADDLALPPGMTIVTPEPYELVQQDTMSPHRSSLNDTLFDIDSTLLAVLPYLT